LTGREGEKRRVREREREREEKTKNKSAVALFVTAILLADVATVGEKGGGREKLEMFAVLAIDKVEERMVEFEYNILHAL
jgi:hypothetical protein